jgi:gamma-glutamyltranspeptidase / glutathione hydrolase
MRRFSVALAVVSMMAADPLSAADLSPGHWSQEARKALEKSEFDIFPSSSRTLTGRGFMVSGTLSPIAVHAGAEALRQGGTAADAAATVALTQIATNLGSVASYAGVLQLLYFDAKAGRAYGLDAGWRSYRDETDPATIPPADLSVVTGQPGAAVAQVDLGRQTLVPGFMAGIQAMHSRFGRLPFGVLFQPAIWYAENGVTISPLLAGYFGMQQSALSRTPEGRRFASVANGKLPAAGDRFLQPDLALTLKAVAAHGADYMYTGDWARHFVASVRAQGGKASLQDLANYKPEWRAPQELSFAGATVLGLDEIADGGCPTLEALSLLPDLAGRQPYWRDAGTFLAFVRALRLAQYGRYLPQFADIEGRGPAPCKARITPEHAKAMLANAGSVLELRPDGAADGGHHTESVVVIDRWGNVAALVHSINAVVWGDTGIIVDGVPIADAAAINKRQLLATKPGRALPTDMAPLIALRNGKPIIAVATVGSSLVQENVRLVAGVLGAGQDLQTLMGAAPLLLNTAPPAGKPISAWPEPVPTSAYDPELLNALRLAGLAVQEETPIRTKTTRGTAAALVIDQASHLSRAIEVPGIITFAEGE